MKVRPPLVKIVTDVISIEDGSVWGDAQGRLYLVQGFEPDKEDPEQFNAVCRVFTDKGARTLQVSTQAFLSHGFMIPIWSPSLKGAEDSEGGEMIKQALTQGQAKLAIDAFRAGFMESYQGEPMGSWTVFYHYINRKAPVDGPASRAMYRRPKSLDRKRKSA